MATLLSRFATNQLQTASADRAGSPVINRFYVDLTAAQMTAGAIIDLGTLQANMTVADATLVSTDIDSGAGAVTLDVGILSGTPGDVANRTCGAEFFAASTIGQAGGVARASLASAFTVAATGADRSIGLKIVAAPSAAVAGRVTLLVTMLAANPA